MNNLIAKFTVTSKIELTTILHNFDNKKILNVFITFVLIRYLESIDFITHTENKITKSFVEYKNTIDEISIYFPSYFTYNIDEDTYKKVINSNFYYELANLDNNIFNDDLISWMYQYYVSDVKEKYKDNRRVMKEDLSSITQLFTPKWIIKYLVDNTLGNFTSQELKYKLSKKFEDKETSLIRILEPCVGTGNFLLYVVEVLYKMYIQQNSDRQDIINKIMNNIYGLDIDEEAIALCKVLLGIKLYSLSGIKAKYTFDNIVSITEEEIKEIGSLYYQNGSLKVKVSNKLKNIITKKYDVVVTNPPYLGRKSISSELKKYINKNIPNAKSELYSAFIIRCIDYACKGGYVGMITLHTWMFISSYSDLRKEIICNYQIESMLHTGANTFVGVNAFNALATSFVIKKNEPKQDTIFIRLCDIYHSRSKEDEFFNEKNYYYVNAKEFLNIPFCSLLYQVDNHVREIFKKYPMLSEKFTIRAGIATGNNEEFVRYWFEVPKEKIGFNIKSNDEAFSSGYTYFPYNKGGSFRKWYGMNEYVIKFDKESFDVLAKQGNKLPSKEYYFKKGITWSLFGFENFSVRFKDYGFVFDVSGSSVFPDEEHLYYLLGFLSSSTCFYLLNMINPTVNFQTGNIASLPYIESEQFKNEINSLVRENIRLAKEDWDLDELSFDFEENYIIHQRKSGQSNSFFEAYQLLLNKQKKDYYKAKANEERINEIFKEIYKIDVATEVNKRDLTIKYPLEKEIVKAFVHRIVHLILIERKYVDIKELYELFYQKLEKIFISDNVNDIIKFINENIDKTSLKQYLEKNLYQDIWKKYSKHPIYFLFTNGKIKGVQILADYSLLDLHCLFDIYKLFLTKDEDEDYIKRFKKLIDELVLENYNFKKDGINRYLKTFSPVIKVYK